MEKTMLAPGVWNVIPTGMAAAFLIVGEEKALLIDSGAGETDIVATCNEITSLPIEVVNTHYHHDHMAANDQFPFFAMHPMDIPFLKEWKQILPVTEGYTFELGGRSVEVIEIPGHTPGSIALLDHGSGLMFTGDMVSKQPIFLIDGDCDLDKFKASLHKLKSYHATMYAAHDPTPNDNSTLDKLIETIDLFRAGAIEPQEADNPHFKAKVYISPNGTGFFCPEQETP